MEERWRNIMYFFWYTVWTQKLSTPVSLSGVSFCNYSRKSNILIPRWTVSVIWMLCLSKGVFTLFYIFLAGLERAEHWNEAHKERLMHNKGDQEKTLKMNRKKLSGFNSIWFNLIQFNSKHFIFPWNVTESMSCRTYKYVKWWNYIASKCIKEIYNKMYIVGYGVGGFVFDLDPKADTEMDWLVSEQKSILMKRRGKHVTSLVLAETEPVIQWVEIRQAGWLWRSWGKNRRRH